MWRPEDLRDELIGHNRSRRIDVLPSTGFDVGAKIEEIKTRGRVGRVAGEILGALYDVRRVMWVPPKD